MMAGNHTVFLNFFHSGKTNLETDGVLRYTLFNAILLSGGLFLILFGLSVYLEGDIERSFLDAGMALVCFAAIAVLRTGIPLIIPGAAAIGAFGILCARFVAGGEIRGFAPLWVYIFPMVSIFILGLQTGLIYSFLLLCTMLTLTFIPGLSKFSYTTDMAARFCGVYGLVAMLSVVYEQVRLTMGRRVSRLTRELKVERDTVSAMKDNLKQGIFLMDGNFIIQGAYSKPLEIIFSKTELEGMKFTDLLVHSLNEKERNTLEDYFGMVLRKAYDTAMLENINPISEFTYVRGENAGAQILQSSFSAIDRGLDDIVILGTVEDVTAAKGLARQITEEESRREEEMRSLFQVIQVEPRVFRDFIEDTEYEFDRINATLMNKNLSADDVLIEIYQSVHAVKSNSIILGLDNFGEKLHALEDTIRKIRDSGDITFDSILHITLELEKVFREKDRFQNIVAKIESFKTTGAVRQDQHVLVETLSRACDKAATAANKKVRFVVDEIDGLVLENGPRRVIREVLTQLVRNSVYHGIEVPADREKGGKDSEGAVRLSIKQKDDHIHIVLSDDGKGLDFAKIRKKALAMNLIKSEKEAEDKNKLLKMIFSPGFTTAEQADMHAGRGIGLNLVRERVRGLRGSIKLSNTPGKGMIFNILIPAGISAEKNKAS
ncbi:MAG: hypothetical protein LBI67_09720 [Treponema sp.]|jgi:two-component system chemotaxis sensor kinase CheA|nr:hypothetical protein [Treponema sp.]